MGFEADFEKWKQEHFGNYCMTKCKKTCCDMQNVSLLVSEAELAWIYGKKIKSKDFRKMGIKPAKAGELFSIESKEYCAKFDRGRRKCLEYSRRPKSCREFPFLTEPDALIIKSGCPLSAGDAEYKKLAEIASLYGKVIVKR